MKIRPEPIKPEIVKEFVGAGHGKFDRTKEMLAEMPSLLNATWDWGGGDFETAIGGAGHMGNREIAEFLISKGARMDIFVAAMLGKLEIVRAMITTYPDLKSARGPHGISLLTHAQKGRAESLAVVEYLQSLGLKE
ncbi:MAG: ankyrin repeat domain-containing protein [Candidatus Kapabacteria bacterium]|nr:ankyrin repeat domain-containing protein [Candidatus Kapabacteria bacterium]